jgi:hypothetical protein
MGSRFHSSSKRPDAFRNPPVYFDKGAKPSQRRDKNQIGMFLWQFKFLPAIYGVFTGVPVTIRETYKDKLQEASCTRQRNGPHRT